MLQVLNLNALFRWDISDIYWNVKQTIEQNTIGLYKR